MATTLSLTTTYVGEAAEDIIRKCFYPAATILNGGVTVKERVHGTWAIRRLSSADLVAPRTCDFTPAGTITIDERALTVLPYEVNAQLCKDDFLVDWSSVRMGDGANNKTLASDVANATIDEIAATVAEAMEVKIWQNATGAGEFDGLIPLMLADDDVVDVAYTGATIDSANVLAIMADVYEAWAATKCFGAPDSIMYVAPNVAASYQAALGAVNTDQGYLTQSVVGEKPWNYLGIPVFLTPGMPAHTIVCTKGSNIFVGTDLSSDLNSVILKDMTETDLSNNVRFLANFMAGVNYGFSDEVILAEPTLT